MADNALFGEFMKNYWLNKKTSKKFKGKFQEADPINRGGRLYSKNALKDMQIAEDVAYIKKALADASEEEAIKSIDKEVHEDLKKSTVAQWDFFSALRETIKEKYGDVIIIEIKSTNTRTR